MKEQTKKVIEKLENKTKNDLLDIVENFLECEILTEDDFDFLFEDELSTEEKQIIQLLKDKQSLSIEQKEYVEECLNKKGNVKTKSILRSKNAFLSFLVQFKIDYYFDVAWKNYPKKVGKELGKKAFVKLVTECKEKELATNCKYVIERIQKYANYCEDNNTDQQYILQFSTFCNSKKYL